MGRQRSSHVRFWMAISTTQPGAGRFTLPRGSTRKILAALVALFMVASTLWVPPAGAQTTPSVTIVSPDDGEILDGSVTISANVADATATSVEFFYDPHEDDEPEISLGLATFNSGTGHWELPWDTTAVVDTFNDLDTDGDDVEDTTVNLTKPPTHDQLRVAALSDAGPLEDAVDVRIQNMLTVRFTLPDNQEDVRGFQDLEAVLTSQFEVTSVRFDLFAMSSAPVGLFTPFGEFQSLGEPIENRQYGRPLGNPAFPTDSATFPIGEGTPEGTRRWVLRGWDTTAIPDGTHLLVATAEDAGGRRATYMVETYIVNDLRVQITAPSDGASVSSFVALEARTSSLTGADNAAPGSLWPATAVDFTIGSTTIPATEIPAGSGRWRAVWDGDSFAPGPYTITATATNANPGGAETAVDSINVDLVAPGAELEAFFPFDWSNCHLTECSFLDGSSGGPNWWLWDFGDGNTSADQLPSHTYASPGVYTVSLTVSNDGGTTQSEPYTVDIPVGNTGVVSFNRNDLDLEGATEFIDWTSAFKNFDYSVGDVLAIPVMWDTTVGSAVFESIAATVCDADEDTPNQECVIFTPEEATGTAPTVVGAAEDGVLFEIAFTDVQFRGITDIFKGKANVRVAVGVDVDGNGSVDQTNQLGTNIDVTNSGVAEDEARLVEIISPFEGEFLGGTETIVAGVVSTLAAEMVEFFVGDTSIGVDGDGSDGWSTTWDTTSFADAPYELSAVATFAGTETTTSAVRNVNVENAAPTEPTAPAGTFQIGRVNDTSNPYITYVHELEEPEEEGGGGPGGGPPSGGLRIPEAAMEAELSNIVVLPGAGVIGGDMLEFDVTIANNSPADSGIVLSAFAFQSKFSESPALASRTGDKLFYGTVVPGSLDTEAASALGNVKKNGTAQGLFSGKWKGICINSSTDFIPEFNSGLEEESLECAGNRSDIDFDGEPELQTGSAMLGLRPGESQTVRLRLDSGTTDGALHVVDPGTLKGRVVAEEVVVPGRPTYLVPSIDNTGVTDPNVVAMPDFGDNKVLRDADGTFNPTFAPAADNYTFDNQTYLTLPRRNFAFTDLIGRNHNCATYGLTLGACSGGGSPLIGFLGTGDLVPGVENFAAILRGFGEFHDSNGDFVPDENPDFAGTGEMRPSFPYDVLCENCGGIPYVPIAEFFVDNGDGSLTQSIVAGSYGDPVAEPYLATVGAATADEVKEDIIPEEEPGGPCDPIADPDSRKPSCAQLRTSATGQFHSLSVVEGAGINGGDAVEFTIDITNTSTNPEAYLTAFNYQSKERNLADIGGLDGFTQDRRDIRLADNVQDSPTDHVLPLCTSLDDEQCYNADLGISHFPNVIGNGLLFGQMVWTDADAGREPEPVDSDQVHVSPSGIDPTQFWLESVKKNGPFTPILKGNTNFICVKSGLFDLDPDADAGCTGQPAILVEEGGELVPDNISQRLGLPPGETQSVRIRMEYGDFRGAMLQIVAGTLNAGNIGDAHAGTGGLGRFFDCSDQRELEFCHPELVGANIGYLPNTDATWLTPETLEEIEYVIINQPGDAARIMNFQANFGHILEMAGFVPGAEFHAPDPNPDLVGTPAEGILIRQQILGEYAGAPTSVLSADCTELDCTLDGSGSSDADTPSEELAFSWQVLDGAGGEVGSGDSAILAQTFTTPGDYTAVLTVTDGDGISMTARETFAVATAPPSDLTITTRKTRGVNTANLSWTGSYGPFVVKRSLMPGVLAEIANGVNDTSYVDVIMTPTGPSRGLAAFDYQVCDRFDQCTDQVTVRFGGPPNRPPGPPPGRPPRPGRR